jgi:hypothetical protein
MAWAGPTSALSIISLTGNYGDFGFLPADAPGTPGARCGYSARLADSYAHLRWIRVRPPTVIAYDSTPQRDHQKATWQVKIQRQVSGGSWNTVAKSGIQTRTVYDDLSGDYNAVKLYVNGSSLDQLFRAVGTIKWLKNGSVDGSARFSITTYGVKWTVGSPDYEYTDACGGMAD